MQLIKTSAIGFIQPNIGVDDNAAPLNGVYFSNTALPYKYFKTAIPALAQSAVSMWIKPNVQLANFLLDQRDVGGGYVWFGGLSNAELFLGTVSVPMSSVPVGQWSRIVVHQGNLPANTILTFFMRYSDNEPMQDFEVSEVRIYDRHFTQQELSDPLTYPEPSQMVARYPLRETPSGNVLEDVIGTYDATLYGF